MTRSQIARRILMAQERMKRLDGKIGQLMTQRVDLEEFTAELLAEFMKAPK